MKIHDITFPLAEFTPVYPGDPTVRVGLAASLAGGDPANVTTFCCGAHTATHVDAPAHFIHGGRRAEDLELEKMIGPCRVLRISDDVDEIEPEHLGALDGVRRIIFKTRNSDFWNNPEQGFRSDYTALSPAAAAVLVEANVELVGIDYLSIEKSDSTDFPTHIKLLENDVVILEGLDLRDVAPGDYELICLPLKLVGETGDGAPARVVLRAKVLDAF